MKDEYDEIRKACDEKIAAAMRRVAELKTELAAAQAQQLITPTVKKSLTVHGARKWVGLTDDEFKQVCWESGGDGITGDREESLRAMEALLKEKNT